MLRGILTVLSQGCKWRASGRSEANWNSIYHYYRRWCRTGLWAEVFARLGPSLTGDRCFLDATPVKVHRCAANPPGGQAGQAMGRTKGGMNTKIHAAVDAAGRPACLLLSAGQDAEITHAATVVENLPARMLVADKGYDSDAFRAWLKARGIQPCIPPRRNRKHPQRYSKRSYRRRHLVENFFERIKNFRRVATRNDKLANSYFGFVCLASTLVSLLW